MKRRLQVTILLALIGCTPKILAQGIFHATVDIGISDGDRWRYSMYTAGSLTYTPLPYLGFQLRMEGCDDLPESPIFNKLEMRTIEYGKDPDGSLSSGVENSTAGIIRFYGTGLSFLPLPIFSPPPRHILAIEAGGGITHAYEIQVKDGRLRKVYEHSGWGLYSTLRYRYQIWQHVSLGGYIGMLWFGELQSGCGASFSIDL